MVLIYLAWGAGLMAAAVLVGCAGFAVAEAFEAMLGTLDE